MYTDNYLYDAANEAEIAKFAAYLISLMKPYRGDLPRDLEIALHIDDDDSGVKQWCYYLASEAERSIFWLEETSPEIFTNHARSVQDESHLSEPLPYLEDQCSYNNWPDITEDAQEAQFWWHQFSTCTFERLSLSLIATEVILTAEYYLNINECVFSGCMPGCFRIIGM